MTDQQTPPDWVLIEAAKRSGWGQRDPKVLRDCYSDRSSYAALCDALWELHKVGLLKPPVDRKRVCADRAYKDWYDFGYRSSSSMSSYIGVRAIELWEEGFGK